MSEFDSIKICAVRQNNDSKLSLGKAFDYSAKAACAASVPHAWVTVDGAEKPAEAERHGFPGREVIAITVGRPISLTPVIEPDGFKSRRHFRLRQKLAPGESVVPMGEIEQVGIDATVAESGGG